jgi:hypothetical protein
MRRGHTAFLSTPCQPTSSVAVDAVEETGRFLERDLHQQTFNDGMDVTGNLRNVEVVGSSPITSTGVVSRDIGD